MNALLARLIRSAIRRGMAGGHWSWFGLALAAAMVRYARRPYGSFTTVRVRRGERYTITVADPKSSDDRA